MPAPVCNVTIANLGDVDTSPYGYMLAGPATMQDITPSSARRSDGDPRFQYLQTQGFRAQADFSAGLGLYAGDDVSSYWAGPADTTQGKQVECAQAGLDLNLEAGLWARAIWYGEQVGTSNRYIYVLSQRLGNFFIWRGPLGATIDTVAYSFPAGVAPTCMATFRGKAYFGYDETADVTWWDPIAGTTGTVTGLKARKLAAYGSMLYGVRWAGTNWTLARWDPENNDVKDVAIAPVTGEFIRGLHAAQGALYLLFGRSLYSFTSQNGTVGTLVGPVDSWGVAFGAGGRWGRQIVEYQGAVVYAAGYQLRSYMPGGQARALYPVAPRSGQSGTNWQGPCALAAMADRLYVALTAVGPGGGALTMPVFCWTGTGMAHVADMTTTWDGGGGVDGTQGVLEPMSEGVLVGCICSTAGTAVLGGLLKRIVAPVRTGDSATETRWGTPYAPLFEASKITGAWLEYGLVDVLKVCHRLRVAGALPPVGGAIRLYYQLDGEATWHQAVAAGAFPRWVFGQDALPGVVEFTPQANAFLGFYRLRWRVELDPGTDGSVSATPLVMAVTQDVDPILPLANGFRFTLRIDTDVQSLDGQKLYPTAAAVSAALARVFNFRRDQRSGVSVAQPLSLVWSDGQTYTVKANTRTVVMTGWRADTGPAWAVTFDAQQVV